MNKLGIIGLGSKSTTYYIELLNLFYNKKLELKNRTLRQRLRRKCVDIIIH